MSRYFELIENFLKDLNSLKISWIWKFYLEKHSTFIQTSHTHCTRCPLDLSHISQWCGCYGRELHKEILMPNWIFSSILHYMNENSNKPDDMHWIHWKLLEFENFSRKTFDFHFTLTSCTRCPLYLSHISQWCGCQEGSFTSKILMPNWTFIRE